MENEGWWKEGRERFKTLVSHLLGLVEDASYFAVLIVLVLLISTH